MRTISTIKTISTTSVAMVQPMAENYKPDNNDCFAVNHTNFGFSFLSIFSLLEIHRKLPP
ncbi:hypothetical protein QI155_06040 [Thermodesulfovibrio sp. 1176]|uniref:hypothetical protein n=1 Tax=Thermodesulfovibrio sp. 1176 TaxID=3043424 RepID=UPI002482A771|nr:hypothetical protein [Thermodesulfovibrio sp. 1176]MDI1472095.1 hypothetical protein [Thermodesulfovibrio sp. 1176]